MSFGYRGKKILSLLDNAKRTGLSLKVTNQQEDNNDKINVTDMNEKSSILSPEISNYKHVDNVIIEDFRNVPLDTSVLLLRELSFDNNIKSFDKNISKSNDYVSTNIGNSSLEQNINFACSQSSFQENNNHETDNKKELISITFMDNEYIDHHNILLYNENDTDNVKENVEPSKEQNNNDSQIVTNENVESEINPDDIMKRKKRNHIAEPSKWKKSVAKRRRMEGKEYIGYSRTPKGVVLHNKLREARKMGASCKSKECLRVKTKKCSEITEEQRRDILHNFWCSLNWDQRKVFVVNHVDKTITKRIYTENPDSRRRYSLHYFLTVDNKKMQVCKKMFLQTLALGEYSVHDWINKGNYGMSNCAEFNQSNKPSNKEKNSEKEFLKDFFNCIPKMPSHYGRYNSSKLYLDTTIRSLSHLYKLYKESCQEENKCVLSITTFTKIFYSMKLSIHPIKKDKCDLCTQYEVGQLSLEEWQIHKNNKEKARAEKKKDKEEASRNQKSRVLTIDLQAIKMCPFVHAKAIFFKLKLCCHNFTVYDLVTHKAKCFWFTEIDADMTASTFISCIMEYLSIDCKNETGPIIIYSDGCTYQNRNNILSNALLNYAIENNIEIIQKFLEVGHTQMECDSVHSCIERKLKGHDIYLPSDYIKITREARMKPFSYHVKTMQYSDFKDYTIKKYQTYASIRPGKVAKDPHVTHIKALKYSPNANIYYKLDFNEDWKELPQRQKPVTEVVAWPQMYTQKRKITYQKWKHLQQLKSVIPTDCHSFYDNLQYHH